MTPKITNDRIEEPVEFAFKSNKVVSADEPGYISMDNFNSQCEYIHDINIDSIDITVQFTRNSIDSEIKYNVSDQRKIDEFTKYMKKETGSLFFDFVKDEETGYTSEGLIIFDIGKCNMSMGMYVNTDYGSGEEAIQDADITITLNRYIPIKFDIDESRTIVTKFETKNCDGPTLPY